MRSRAVPHFAKRLADAWVSRGASEAHRPVDSTHQPAVVVIGGSRGIGLEIARAFAEDGQRVAIVARSESGLAEATRELARSASTTIETIALDATPPGAPAELEARLAALGLYADILVMSAGIGLSGRFEEQTPLDLERLIALNITAMTRHVHHVLPAMRARGSGGVITLASLGGYVPGPNQAAYYASKAYVLSLTEALASELGGSGVRVTAVAPGPVATGFHASMGAEYALYRRMMPSTSPRRVARAAHTGFLLGRRVVVPGLIMTLTAAVLRILPHPLTVPFVGRLLQRRETGRSHS